MSNQQAQDRQVPAPLSGSKPGSLVSVVNSAPPQAFLAKGGTEEQWSVLTKQFFPDAKSPDTVMLVVDYCRARKLDPMLKPFHIVPFYKNGQECDSIVPGVNLYEIIAHRTGEFGGADKPVYCDEKKHVFTHRSGGKQCVVEAPNSCSVTVYRDRPGKQRAAYTGEVFYKEYATLVKTGENAGYPRDNWRQKPHMMMSKCALAAALRLAFPEECGSSLVAEEMEGREEYDVDAEVSPANEKDLMKDPATQAVANAGKGGKRGSATQALQAAANQKATAAPTTPGAAAPSTHQVDATAIVVEAESVQVSQEAPQQHGSVNAEPTSTGKSSTHTETSGSAKAADATEAAQTTASATSAESTSSATTTNDDALISAEDWARLQVKGQPLGWLNVDIERLCMMRFNLPEDSPRAISMKEAKRVAAVISTKKPEEVLPKREG
jgi:phage recombination protein Bet